MERRSILEKLGLIEKVENEDNNEQVTANIEEIKETKEKEAKEIKDVKEAVTVEKEKKEFVDYMKSAEIQKEQKTSAELRNDSEDPVATVKKKKLLKIEEIYKNYDVFSDGINSLSIVESFQKALPDYLPTDVKRESILNIIASSNVRLDSLVKDGNDKLNCLKDFSKSFNDESSEVILNFEYEINKLNEKIKNFKTAIDNMKKLQSEQDFTVKYEIDKINNILQFIDPEK